MAGSHLYFPLSHVERCEPMRDDGRCRVLLMRGITQSDILEMEHFMSLAPIR